MTFHRIGWLASAGCLFVFLLAACGSSSSGSAGAGGDDGTTGCGGGGAGGAPIEVPALNSGLWETANNQVEVCFVISTDGSRLVPGPKCDLTAGGQSENSFALSTISTGRDERGEPCGVDLSFAGEVPVDESTGVFQLRNAPMPGGGSLSFSGEIVKAYASGMAVSTLNGSVCEVPWGAIPTAECDQAAINACLDLQECCESILLSPVFFQTCNSVAVAPQCDRRRCEEVLAGYPQCRGEEEPQCSP